MEINVKEVWLLNMFAEEICYSKLYTFMTHRNAPFLKKLFPITEKKA